MTPKDSDISSPGGTGVSSARVAGVDFDVRPLLISAALSAIRCGWDKDRFLASVREAWLRRSQQDYTAKMSSRQIDTVEERMEMADAVWTEVTGT